MLYNNALYLKYKQTQKKGIITNSSKHHPEFPTLKGKKGALIFY